MKWKSKSCPEPSVGQKTIGGKQVVPDQSMSLQEILHRFTRNEQLPIGKDVQYHESDDDIEQLSHMDLVDREEFIERLKHTQDQFKTQEAKKAAQQKKRLEDEIRAKIEADVKRGSQPDPAK